MANRIETRIEFEGAEITITVESAARDMGPILTAMATGLDTVAAAVSQALVDELVLR